MTAGKALPSLTTNTKSWRPRCERSRSHQPPAGQTLRRRRRPVDGSRGAARRRRDRPRDDRAHRPARRAAPAPRARLARRRLARGARPDGRRPTRAASRAHPCVGLRARTATRGDPARRRATTTPALRPPSRHAGPRRAPTPQRTPAGASRRAAPGTATTATRARKRAAAPNPRTTHPWHPRPLAAHTQEERLKWHAKRQDK